MLSLLFLSTFPCLNDAYKDQNVFCSQSTYKAFSHSCLHGKKPTRRRVGRKVTTIISVSMFVYQLIYFKRGRRVLGLEYLRICDCVDTGKLCVHFTVKNEKKIFLIYQEIQKRSGAKSYMRKDFLKYEEMRKYFIICEEALVMYDFDPIPSEFPYI